MVIVFDKNFDSNISSIISSNIDADILFFQSETNHAWTIDTKSYNIRMGADDVTVAFNNYESMVPYIEQFKALHPMRNPFKNGVNPDPYYDRPKSGEIVNHSYSLTDIEKDLINGVK